jgi:hypothetical protein
MKGKTFVVPVANTTEDPGSNFDDNDWAELLKKGDNLYPERPKIGQVVPRQKFKQLLRRLQEI